MNRIDATVSGPCWTLGSSSWGSMHRQERAVAGGLTWVTMRKKSSNAGI